MLNVRGVFSLLTNSNIFRQILNAPQGIGVRETSPRSALHGVRKFVSIIQNFVNLTHKNLNIFLSVVHRWNLKLLCTLIENVHRFKVTFTINPN